MCDSSPSRPRRVATHLVACGVPVLLASALLTSAAAGQQPSPSGDATYLVPGARVRVTLPGGTPEVGTLVAHTRDSLRVRWAGGDTTSLPLVIVEGVEVSRGKRSRTAEGLLTGVLLGGIAGGLLGMSGDNEPDCGDSPICPDIGPSITATSGALFGAMAGFAIGGVIGSHQKGDVWKRVPLERVRVGVAVPSSRRAGGLVASFTF